jgi:hypothetical protein
MLFYTVSFEIAPRQVIIHHTDRLQIAVNNGASHEFEAEFLHVTADFI